MKKQIVVIHGGETFDTYEEYVAELKTKPVDLEYVRTRKIWRTELVSTLGKEYDVIQLQMPNKNNAKYSEWKIWLERFVPLFNDEVLFIGHSLGGIFLVKYLSENKYPKKVRATLLVAPPFDLKDTDFSLADFTISPPLNNFEKQAGKVVFYFSKDDTVVPFVDSGKYTAALPLAEIKTFSDRGLFHQLEFPEIIEDIKKLFT